MVLLVDVGLGFGATESLQKDEPVPQYPHCEQHKPELGHWPFPTLPPPQVPRDPSWTFTLTGEGVGRRVGRFVGLRVGLRLDAEVAPQ